MSIKRIETEWNDDTFMTFGKFKGMQIQYIPADYLHWFWHNVEPIKGKDSERLMKYIKNIIPHLKDENDDLIWDIRKHESL